MKSLKQQPFVIDLLSISILIVLSIGSFTFITVPHRFLHPWFPVLDIYDWPKLPTLIIQEPRGDEPSRPWKWRSPSDSDKTNYHLNLSILDTAQPVDEVYFFILHDVTWYVDNDEAVENYQAQYDTLLADVKGGPWEMIADIPELNFSSRADRYQLWCEVIPREPTSTYVNYRDNSCYYLALYGQYVSLLRVSMLPSQPVEAHYNLEVFKIAINLVDKKGVSTLQVNFVQKKHK